MFSTLNFDNVSKSVAEMAQSATYAASQGVGTMSEVFDDPNSIAKTITSLGKTKEELEAEEVYEAERLRLKERELRRKEEIRNGAEKLRGKWAKQTALASAKANAAEEKRAQEEKVLRDKADAIERDRRLQEKEALYITRIEAKQEEARLMEAEERATRDFLMAEKVVRQRKFEKLRMEAVEAKRCADMAAGDARREAERVAEEAHRLAGAEEREQVAMGTEEWRTIKAWQHAAEIIAALEAERAACDWEELVALLKPHGLTDDAALDALRLCGAVSTRRAVGLEDDLRGAGFNKMRVKKLVSVCSADIQNEADHAAFLSVSLEVYVANRRRDKAKADAAAAQSKRRGSSAAASMPLSSPSHRRASAATYVAASSSAASAAPTERRGSTGSGSGRVSEDTADGATAATATDGVSNPGLPSFSSPSLTSSSLSSPRSVDASLLTALGKAFGKGGPGNGGGTAAKLAALLKARGLFSVKELGALEATRAEALVAAAAKELGLKAVPTAKFREIVLSAQREASSSSVTDRSNGSSSSSSSSNCKNGSGTESTNTTPLGETGRTDELTPGVPVASREQHNFTPLFVFGSPI